MVLAFGEDDAMRPLTVRDESRDWSGLFNNVTEGSAHELWIVTSKGPECDVWVGAFNHLHRTALLRDLACLAWESPDSSRS